MEDCKKQKRKGIITMNTMNEESTKAFELRNLTADDMFPMFQIISKIGVKEFKNCFEAPDVKKALEAVSSGKDGQDALAAVGMAVAFDLAGVIISNLPSCKDDIYLLLSQLSGMKTKDIASLPMVTFVEMIVAVIKKEELTDFFQAVSKLFK
jgi:hypothetical protein